MWYVFIFIATLLIDQVTKILVASASGVAGTVEGSKHLFWVIDDVIEVAYSENKNGAMGLFKDFEYAQQAFIIATAVIVVGILAFLIFSKKKRSPWLNTTFAFILSGAIGNFIDRLTTVYVRDFIHVIIPIGESGDFFPYIFNVADILVVLGAIMFIFYLLFLAGDAIFRPKKKKAQ